MKDFDLKQYMDVIDRVNQDQIASRREGISKTIARLILEGGLTFDDEPYCVAILVKDYGRGRILTGDIYDLVVHEFYDDYSRVVGDIKVAEVLGKNHMVKIKVITVPCADVPPTDKLKGRRIHNYFLDISDCDEVPYLPRILDEMDSFLVKPYS